MDWSCRGEMRPVWGHTQLEELIKVFHVCIHLCTTPITCRTKASGDASVSLLNTCAAPTCRPWTGFPAPKLQISTSPIKTYFFQTTSLQFFFLLFSSPHFLPPKSINITVFQNSKEPWFSISSDILRGCIKPLSSFSTLPLHLVPQLSSVHLEPLICPSVPSHSFL